ncbi:hypothetical protein [Mesorhizobium sp.]|uniref:hypothetical protein n=1 Tax=Mesorhizobium sp. TaxID=1871066 RepID=UPI00257DA137|nr:hypothetical protein [Mesorhizobium sp.]
MGADLVAQVGGRLEITVSLVRSRNGKYRPEAMAAAPDFAPKPNRRCNNSETARRAASAESRTPPVII